jgi:hypothetical protein
MIFAGSRTAYRSKSAQLGVNGKDLDMPDGRAPAELVAAVEAEASAHAEAWFPELDTRRLRTRLLATDARARCFLHRFELADGRSRRTVVVKVRHSRPELRRLDRFEGRPVLNPERTMSDDETARREYDGLLAIAHALGGCDEDRFGVLRPLAWLPMHSAIVMDLVQEPTLRHRLLETSRLRRRRRPPMDETAWVNAGSWLRRFHDVDPGHSLLARVETGDQVAQLYTAYAEFLARRGAPSSFTTRLIDGAVDLSARAFLTDLPLAPGHGDFVANNMFAGPSGRITVFDPLTRWRVPRYQDIATLTVGIRVLPVQSASQGVALPGADLERYEDAVLAGYFDAERVPLAAVRGYQLLVLLDRWSATVGKRHSQGTVRPGLHEVRVRLASRHYHREAQRLLRLLG